MSDEADTIPPLSVSDGQATRPGELLLPEEEYLTAGVHIGTQQKSASMRRFVYKVRYDGLYVLDIRETDRRIRVAGKLISRLPSARVLAVSQRPYGQKPVRLFAQTIGAQSFSDRFVPGCLTNPNLKEYLEPQVILVTDPTTDQQALSEAVSIGIPVIGICDVNNETRNVDFVIPANNKGRVALATIYWLLAREVIRCRTNNSSAEMSIPINEFQSAI